MKLIFFSICLCLFISGCSHNATKNDIEKFEHTSIQKEHFKDFGTMEMNEKNEDMPEWKNFIQMKDNYDSGKIVLRTYNDKGECSPITMTYDTAGYTQQIDNRENSDVEKKERIVVEKHYKYLYAIDGKDFDELMKDASLIACFVKDPTIYMHWYLANEKDMNPFINHTDMAFVLKVLK